MHLVSENSQRIYSENNKCPCLCLCASWRSNEIDLEKKNALVNEIVQEISIAPVCLLLGEFQILQIVVGPAGFQNPSI